MLKSRAIVGAAALSVLLGGLVWMEGSADAATFTCNGVIQNQTIPGNVTVPTNGSCALRNVTITGNLSATAPRQLLIALSRIKGTVNVNGFQHNGTTSALCGTVEGNIYVTNLPAGAAVDESGDPGFPLGGGDDYTGTPVGDFTCDLDARGGLLFSGNAENVSSEANNIVGNVSISNNSGEVELDSNTIRNNVSVTGNSGSVAVDFNTITGNLSCSGNANISGANNTAAKKTGQCAAF